MGKRFGTRSVTAAALALAIAGCSSGGDDGGVAGGGDGGVPVAGGGGLGTIAGGGQPADDGLGGAAANPFQTGGGGGERPEEPDVGGGTGGGTAGPGGGGGGGGLPFGNGGSVTDDEPQPTPAGGAVLGRLQNSIVNEELADLWACAAPQVADTVQAVGYVFIESQGFIILIPNEGEGEPTTALFAVDERSAGTLVNTYQEIDAVEEMSDFRFAGAESFTATSTLVGSLECQRFSLADDGDSNDGDTGGGGGGAVSAQVLNTLGPDGQPDDIWACRGPQASGETVLYGFYGNGGLFVALNEGQDPVVLQYAYSEASSGTLDLTYQDGFEERLDGFAFSSASMFDMTSTSDGALSCTLANISNS